MSIKNRKSRYTGNISSQDTELRQNNNKNNAQYRKLKIMSNTDPSKNG